MKVTASTSLSNVTSVDDLKRFTAIFCAQVAQAVNGNLTFADNSFVQLIPVNFPAANATVGVNHSLNVIPYGYILIGSDAAMVLYDGTQANTVSTLFLRSSALGNARILVMG